MCGEVEQAADAIIAGTNDPDVQLAALRWKIEAVPAMRAALFQPDVGAPGLDTLVLCYQMADYFETGPGKQALGPAASTQAVAACRRMQDEMTRVMASATISGDVAQASAFAKKWAAEHPIRSSIADRESVLSRVFEREFVESLSTGEAIADVTVTLDDLNRKLEVYSDQLFRQARWEVERFNRETFAQLRADEAIPLAERAVKSADQAAAMLERVAPALDRALLVAHDVPKLVATEHDAAFKAMREEMTRTFQFMREERVAALEQLSKERVIAIEELQQTVTQQRQQFTRDVDQLTVRKIDYAMLGATRLVVAAVAALIVAAALGIFLARWVFARRRPGEVEEVR
jgi:hypothetical protein